MNGVWIGRFPSLSKLPELVRKRLEAESRIVNLSEGTRIFGPGQSPANFLLLLAGTIRVQQISESGREIVLYRVSAGESPGRWTSSTATAPARIFCGWLKRIASRLIG